MIKETHLTDSVDKPEQLEQGSGVSCALIIQGLEGSIHKSYDP